jgi:hypothetical protein
MDINYLLRREQIAIARAESSGSRCARAAHRAFAQEYGRRLVESSYPHNRFQTDAERELLRANRRAVDVARAGWENEGGAIAASKAEQRLV